MVKLSQPWKTNVQLVDISGSNGNLTGDGAAAMRYCVTGDTIVKTNRGTLPIKDVYDQFKEFVKEDGTVVTDGLKFKSLNGVWNNASVIFNCGKHPVMKIKLRNGLELKGTHNHPVLTIDKNAEFVWKEMGKVSAGDFVVIDYNSNRTNYDEVCMDIREARYLGAMVSEGYITTGNRIGINNYDNTIIEAVTTYLSAKLKKNILITSRLGGSKTLNEVLVYSPDEYDRLLNTCNFGRYSSERSIPPQISKSSNRIKCEFLKYLFEGDGSINIRYTKSSKFSGGSIQLSSASKRLALDTSMLLNELGIGTTFSKTNGEHKPIEYKVSVSSLQNLMKFRSQIGFLSSRKIMRLDKLIDILKVSCERESSVYILTHLSKRPRRKEVQTFDKFKKNKHNLSSHELCIFNKFYSNHRAVEIMEIEYLDKEEVVYSPKIESSCNSFISNGIVSHNTEMRLSKTAKLLTEDLKYNTVETVPNFDGTATEPIELPSRIPMLLINGSYGIAVGFTSSFAPHNPYDATLLCKKYNLDRDMKIEAMIDVIKAPDYPSGGIINGLDGVRKAYMTGTGKCKVRGTLEYSIDKKGYDIVDITCLPPSTNYDEFKERIFKLYQLGEIKLRERITDLTDGDGIRIRLVLKKDEDKTRIENLLYKAGLESSTSIIQFALVNGVPKNVTLKDVVSEFIEFRERIVFNRSKFKKDKAENDLHIQKGLRICYDNLDEIIQLIRDADDDREACALLIKKYKLSQKQAEYILEMKLKRLTSLESNIVDKKIKELNNEIDILTKITSSKSNKHITKIIDEEFDEALALIKKEYGTERKTEIYSTKKEVTKLDTIKDEPRTFVYTLNGRLKNMDIALSAQGRNGSGSTLISQEDDSVEIVLPTSTTSKVLIFTNKGKVYAVEPWRIDVTSKSARGVLAKTILGLGDKERIIYMKSLPREYDSTDKYIVFITTKGKIKKSPYSEYESINATGKLAIKLEKEDSVASVQIYEKNPKVDILMTSYEGYSLRTSLDKVTSQSRLGTGVAGMKLKNNKDYIVSGILVDDKSEFIFCVNADGQVKKVEVSEFSRQGRGGYGVITGSKIVSLVPDTDGMENLFLVSKQNMSIIIPKSSIRKVGRTGVGVKGMKLSKGDSILKMFEA